MPGAAARRGRPKADIWPGFVDALAALLMVIIFLLMVFVLAQVMLSQALSGRDEALRRLRADMSELTDLLSLERKANADLRFNVARMSEELQASVRRRDDMADRLRGLERDNVRLDSENRRLAADLDAAFASLREDRATLDLKLREIAALRGRLDESSARAAAARSELEAANRAIEVGAETIDAKVAEIAALNDRIDALKALKAELEGRLLASDASLTQQRELSETARAQAALLRRQLQAVRDQIAALNEALEASERRNAEQQVRIADLGRRLNTALAGKVQELARYRSEFFGRLRDILGDRRDVRIEGDRFVLQSEVLFEQGSADLGNGGRAKLDDLAHTLDDVAARIPDDIDWILRVDGHTDRRPINNWRFPSNWELSTARAISVVRHLIARGLPAERLAATGFADQHPLDAADSDDAHRRNRRIEFKLTQR